MKRCYSCGMLKPTSEFSRDHSKPDGLQSGCKSCRKESSERSRAHRASMPRSKAKQERMTL